MNFKEIQELIRIVDESGLTTVEVEQDGFKIVLKKKIEKIISSERVEPTYTGPSQEHQMTGEERKDFETIKSPIVGTFYSSSSPGQPPFVTVGTKVAKGEILCIIEAMKLMNEIEAEEDVVILEILVQDGQMIEYGHPLFRISKA